MMETPVNISENCSDCLSEDILNIFINPHLHSITQVQLFKSHFLYNYEETILGTILV